MKAKTAGMAPGKRGKAGKGEVRRNGVAGCLAVYAMGRMGMVDRAVSQAHVTHESCLLTVFLYPVNRIRMLRPQRRCPVRSARADCLARAESLAKAR